MTMVTRLTLEVLRDAIRASDGDDWPFTTVFELRDDGVYLRPLPPGLSAAEVMAATGGLAASDTGLPLLKLPCTLDELAAFEGKAGLFALGEFDEDEAAALVERVAALDAGAGEVARALLAGAEQTEAVLAQQARRYERFVALGGTVEQGRGAATAWNPRGEVVLKLAGRRGALADLVKEERGRQRFDRHTIKADVLAEARRRAER
jgi:hypothetical protein